MKRTLEALFVSLGVIGMAWPLTGCRSPQLLLYPIGIYGVEKVEDLEKLSHAPDLISQWQAQTRHSWPKLIR